MVLAVLEDRGRILDLLDDVVVVFDRSDRCVYWNRVARRALGGLSTNGQLAAWPDLVTLVVDVRKFAEPMRRTGLAVPGSDVTWSARLFLVDDDCVAAVLRAESQSGHREAVIKSRLGLTNDQAVLALRVAEGRPNRDIAADFDVTLSTVKGRLWRLYRKLGVRNRAELTGQVVQNLSPN